MAKRVPQPPIDRELRPSEDRAPLLGLCVLAIGLLCAGIGWCRFTRVETVEGVAARESQINLAFAHGGLTKVKSTALVKPPPGAEPPSWMKDQAGIKDLPEVPAPASLKNLKINLQARTPCPT
jgi:hypothetical protein